MAEPLATIRPVSGLGMVTIRADLARAGYAIAEAVGLAVPETLSMTSDGARSLGWMSPDELLLLLPVGETIQALADLSDALTGEDALIVDVSDARTGFDVIGAGAGDVIAKLVPLDLARLPADGFRRSRAAQIAIALWPVAQGYRVIGYRSVTDYLRLILENAALPGSGLAPR